MKEKLALPLPRLRSALEAEKCCSTLPAAPIAEHHNGYRSFLIATPFQHRRVDPRVAKQMNAAARVKEEARGRARAGARREQKESWGSEDRKAANLFLQHNHGDEHGDYRLHLDVRRFILGKEISKVPEKIATHGFAVPD